MATYAYLVADQGSDFTAYFQVLGPDSLPCDLTDYSVRGQIRQTYSSETAVPFDSILILDTLNGQIQFTLKGSTSRTMVAGRYVYDIEVYTVSPDSVTRIMEGILEITPAVTQPT